MSITKFMRRCPDRDKVEEHDFYSIIQGLLNNPSYLYIDCGKYILLIYSFIVQTETMEADGFQADTEDDDDEDCVLISTQSGELHRGNTNTSLSWLKKMFLRHRQFLATFYANYCVWTEVRGQLVKTGYWLRTGEMADHTVWHVKICLQAFCLIHTATKK